MFYQAREESFVFKQPLNFTTFKIIEGGKNTFIVNYFKEGTHYI